MDNYTSVASAFQNLSGWRKTLSFGQVFSPSVAKTYFSHLAASRREEVEKLE
jgi:hypothetical protein